MTPTWQAGSEDARVLERCSHIAGEHHNALREAFARIEALLGAVVCAHSDDQPRLRDLPRAFEQFRATRVTAASGNPIQAGTSLHVTTGTPWPAWRTSLARTARLSGAWRAC